MNTAEHHNNKSSDNNPIRTRLRRLREKTELAIEGRLGAQSAVVQRLDVLLRGGKPRAFALVGASGTGKSFRALLLAETHNISFLIDDGILIEGGRIVAGRSAKNEDIYIKAIKTALFDDLKHRAEVCEAIKTEKVRRVLLVGTSAKMVRLIAERLKLSYIADNDIVYIDEISSPEEIERARKNRHAGHHIIPVPAIEVSREYGSLIRGGFQVFLSDLSMGVKHYLKAKVHHKRDKVFEKTVVKPQFMKTALEDNIEKPGHIQVSESALRQMLIHCIDEYNQEIQVMRIRLRISRKSYKVKIFIRMPLHKLDIQEGKTLNSFLYQLQNYMVNSLQRYAGVTLEELNIEVVEFI